MRKIISFFNKERVQDGIYPPMDFLIHRPLPSGKLIMKLFYSCPIIAAYMAKHFGVTFVFRDVSGCVLRAPESPEEIVREGGYFAPYYVHPETAHLFKPQMGDVCVDGACKISVYDEGFLMPVRNIIQRGGRLFFWPQQD